MLGRRELILAVAVAMTLAGGNRKSAAGPPSKTLVFEGTVTSIGIVDNERRPWLITVKVTKVVAGEFSGSTFEFVVHSPARSGLEKGHSYTIEAVWNGKGYIVDENQWLRRRQMERGMRPREPSTPPLQSDLAHRSLRSLSRPPLNGQIVGRTQYGAADGAVRR